MNVQVLGCSHHDVSIALRERLVFSAEQARRALGCLRSEFPRVESVLLSTCNRMELYTATQSADALSGRQLAEFLGRFHHVDPAQILRHACQRAGAEAIRHLFLVASSLDSMVAGEPQILAQVKRAYRLATQQSAAGPLTRAAFQAALRVSRRVSNETTIHLACQRSRREREKELPKALRIIDLETQSFLAQWEHRAVSPVVRQLRESWHEVKQGEVERLFHKLPELDEQARVEVCEAFDRFVNKLLHPPVESLRGQSRFGKPHPLLEAASRLFRVKD